MRERIVVDTNIVVNALKNWQIGKSKSISLIEDIYKMKYEVYYSTPIMEEYKRVLLGYKRLGIKKLVARRWLIWVKKHAIQIEPQPSDHEHVDMRDEDDRKFFDTAKCANAKLVTRNYRDYPVHEIITLIDELY